MNIIDWILYIPLALCVCYLLLYAIASKFYRAPQYPEARMLRRIAVLFPAYKEDRVILASVESFLKQDYPKNWKPCFYNNASIQFICPTCLFLMRKHKRKKPSATSANAG